ncbi:protein FAM124A [Salarias fasciatus]|uniref:protein FAM124A n=1 Tax=Salarias fasciatus TaxID=181472 RepID=UPI0011764B3E|nr:protein FAM124A [Salarias fasciatus]
MDTFWQSVHTSTGKDKKRSQLQHSNCQRSCIFQDRAACETQSDYSPLSSTSSELSMGELQDPFLVSVHLLADPGQARVLQRAADAVLSWVHPDLQLFRVSERASVYRPARPGRLQNGGPAAACQPALAVILFLQEASGGEEQIATLRRTLREPPWRYHHTEKVSNGRRMLPLTPCSQDFFTLAPGTPLWAVRQVHYGKEVVRFTVYCRHEAYPDMVRLYRLLLRRRLAQKKEDFCFFVVYSNPDMEVQLSFKRLPRGRSPAALESAVMEVRVRDVGELVPLLPRPCSPISELRWQTEDCDGNKLLLQVQSVHFRPVQDAWLVSSAVSESASAPPTSTRTASSHKTRRYQPRAAPRPRRQASHGSLPLACEDPDEPEDPLHPDGWRSRWGSRRSGSIFSLPNLGSGGSRSTCSSPHPRHGSPSLHRSSSLVPPFRLNVDALIGAEETDVDTGDRVPSGGGVDLTVVSAYIKSGAPQTSRPLSAPPEDVGPPFPPVGPETVFRSATLGRTQTDFSVRSTPSTLPGSRPHSARANASAAASLSDVSLKQSDGVEEDEDEDEDEDDDQEFYI